ncbi:MAG: DNA methyltransferase [Terrisporobacter othiniensis]|uniref:TRM11 family SAM-dependent methyltransferase n=1 Tax=Terrisporobacter othiniensis TaxID=1577792 RepID=UPI002911869A|nr:DNA methyltransferase [Terrisporobacter othiniensis]MDU6985300.1 DNA methyltransferase [Terrisporobacter othiniensis]
MITIDTVENTTIWSFPNRGNWSNHKGDYPGNWSPHVPKNIILRYSKEGDMVLDQFVGSGTTLIEAKRLNRRCIGSDINENALNICKQRIKENNDIFIKKQDARNLRVLKDESIDLICTHPPYSDVVKYSENIKCDISLLQLEEFYREMELVAKSSYRVLKHRKYCAILMGDKRKKGLIEPIGFNTMNIFLNVGFKLKEIVIKEQHNCRNTDKWKQISVERNFLLIAHEYLFVFIKD